MIAPASTQVLRLTPYRALKRISSGVTDGISRTIEDMPEDTNTELELKTVAQDMTKELSNSLSLGVPRRLFESLYQSFSQLNVKLASRVEINITPECHDLGYPLDYEGTSRPSPSVSASAQSLGHYEFCEDPHDPLGLSEGQSVGTIGRCCVCSALSDEEELVTTLCCFRVVGSICFEKALEETGSCCLCEAHQPRSDSRCSEAPSDGAADHKILLCTEDHHLEKAEPGLEKAKSTASASGFPLDNAVADDAPRIPDASEELIANVNEKKDTKISDTCESFPFDFPFETKKAARDRRLRFYYNRPVSLEDLKNFSRDFKLNTPVPEDIVPYVTNNMARQQSHELVTDAHLRTHAPITTAITVSAKPQISAGLEIPNVQMEEQHDCLITKPHRLKLIDQDVIYYLKAVQEKDLLNFVHSALKERVPRTACKRLFQQAQGLKDGNVDLSICLKCSQDSELMKGMRDWPRAFESFMLTTQLRIYKVTVEHIQIGTMNLLQGFEKATTIQTLVNDNVSVLKSLKASTDIRGICWNKRIIDLRPIESTSITITFATAQQANEAIEYGILWNHERRLCRRQGAHSRISQCGHCQGYGHLFRDCSSAPRCRTCAALHLSVACTNDAATNKACLKCALCGGAHDATSENCKLRKVERRRIQLESRFYPTEAERGEKGKTASAA